MILDFGPPLIGEFTVEKVVEPSNHGAAIAAGCHVNRTKRVKRLVHCLGLGVLWRLMFVHGILG